MNRPLGAVFLCPKPICGLLKTPFLAANAVRNASRLRGVRRSYRLYLIQIQTQILLSADTKLTSFRLCHGRILRFLKVNWLLACGKGELQ